jgi:mannose-6-phosphate isomerase-like protein (cupin superfamily)
MNPDEGTPKRRVRFEEAAARLAGHDEPVVSVFRHGTLEVELYAPRGRDAQTPHDRDEVYVVVRGTGTFVHGDQRDPCAPHDVLFAPAGLEHRFEGFTSDFMVWVMFYGPEGGERGPADRRHGGDRRLETPRLHDDARGGHHSPAADDEPVTARDDLETSSLETDGAQTQDDDAETAGP